MFWDEDNRLMVLSDNGKTSRYTYNACGERIIKSHGSMEGVYINGAPQGITFHETDEFTLYPASIITVNRHRFTKHYFIGDKRVASRLGLGEFRNVYGSNGSNVTAGQQDYAERMNQIEQKREEYYKLAGVAPGLPTMKGSYADPEVTGKGYNILIDSLGDHSVPENWVQRPVVNTEAGSNPGAPLAWGSPENPDDVVAGYGYVPCDTSEVEETFYYHSDHLGSTAYITDQQANVTQYDAYLPYGELLVDEHSSSEEMPYKFNGKELDEETGLYYYGARYMNPATSMWYGVDAMAEGKPVIGSYVYCMGNPIVMIDPDGNWERNSAGNLVAQKGDNAVTLGKYLGINKHDALRILLSNGVTIGKNNILNLSVGQEITIGKLNAFNNNTNNQKKVINKYEPNIDRAVYHLNMIAENSYYSDRRFKGKKPDDQSTGHCAMHVCMALEAGKFDVKGHPIDAFRYSAFLKKKGWREVSPIGYIPQKGDLIVMSPFVGRKKHLSGHIQMWNGTQWVSDFKQKALYAGRDYREFRPKYVILRIEGEK